MRMADQKCLNRKCANRKRKAVWMVDRVPMCNVCYNRFMESNNCTSIQSIRRLSDNDADFVGERKSGSGRHVRTLDNACTAIT